MISVHETVAAYLGVDIADLRKPLMLPPILVGLDVEISEWDEQCTFAKQDEHFEAGFPCRSEAGLVESSACEIDESPIKRPRAGPR